MTELFKDPILSWPEAAKLAQDCRDRGGIVVTTNGCFDLLPKGHVTYLHWARSQGDLLLVGINSDASVRRIKPSKDGPARPLNPQDARAAVLAALRSVDGVCVFNEDTPVEWLRAIHPNLHIKGGDWDPAKMPESKVIAEWGGRVVKADYVEGYSTTSLLEKSRAKTPALK